ncbi:MAG: hypothetical protein OHK0015_10010 [Chloroflexi bacterium OHK40]
MAEALITAFRGQSPQPITEVRLIPSEGGRFEVRIDDELVYSKLATRQHTTNEHVIELVRARLGQ